jgi:DNA-damage-inducible protein J
MTLMTRTAVLQARVRPEIKYASEEILRSIGLTMTEAMELFLRRLIVDRKLPFEVIALDDFTLATIAGAWEKEQSIDAADVPPTKRRRLRQKKRQ